MHAQNCCFSSVSLVSSLAVFAEREVADAFSHNGYAARFIPLKALSSLCERGVHVGASGAGLYGRPFHNSRETRKSLVGLGSGASYVGAQAERVGFPLYYLY